MGKVVWYCYWKAKEDATASVLTSFPQGTILVEKGPATRIWQAGQSDYYQLQVGGPYQATGGWEILLLEWLQDLQANSDRPVSTNVWQ